MEFPLTSHICKMKLTVELVGQWQLLFQQLGGKREHIWVIYIKARIREVSGFYVLYSPLDKAYLSQNTPLLVIWGVWILFIFGFVLYSGYESKCHAPFQRDSKQTLAHVSIPLLCLQFYWKIQNAKAEG